MSTTGSGPTVQNGRQLAYENCMETGKQVRRLKMANGQIDLKIRITAYGHWESKVNEWTNRKRSADFRMHSTTGAVRYTIEPLAKDWSANKYSLATYRTLADRVVTSPTFFWQLNCIYRDTS